jgi:hypothetical protein
MREDGCVMPRHPTHGAEASSTRAVLPGPEGTVARPEQEREHACAPPTHFSEAQAEHALWQEFRDHGGSLNNMLNEALRIHAGPVWRVFQVHVFSVVFWSFSPFASSALVFPLTWPPPCLVCW